MVVVDTSVVFKWFVPEEGTDHALELRSAHVSGSVRLATSDLCLVELANALRFRRPIPTAEAITDAIRTILELDIRVVATTPDLIGSAARLSLDHGLSMYDSVFVALASDLGYELVTADGALLRQTQTLGFVRSLNSWQPPVRR